MQIRVWKEGEDNLKHRKRVKACQLHTDWPSYCLLLCYYLNAAMVGVPSTEDRHTHSPVDHGDPITSSQLDRTVLLNASVPVSPSCPHVPLELVQIIRPSKIMFHASIPKTVVYTLMFMFISLGMH